MMWVSDVQEQVRVFAVTDDDAEMARGIAKNIGAPVGVPLQETDDDEGAEGIGGIKITWFANGVPEPRFTQSIRGKYVVLVCSIVGDAILKSRLLEMATRAARDSHAGFILVVIPYSVFWRSDKKDKSGMELGAKYEAEKIKLAGAHHVLLCDLHNDTVEGFFDAPDTITVQSVLLEYAKKLGTLGALAAADIGAGKKTKLAAAFLGVPYGMTDKSREGQRDNVDLSGIYGVNYAGVEVGIFEDEILTARTIEESAGWLKNFAKGAAVYAFCSHAPFMYVDGALERLSYVDKTIITNTVAVPATPTPELRALITNGAIEIIDVSPVFGDAVGRIINFESFGSLHAFRKMD